MSGDDDDEMPEDEDMDENPDNIEIPRKLTRFISFPCYGILEMLYTKKLRAKIESLFGIK